MARSLLVIAVAASKTAKPALRSAWYYFKMESAPPFCSGFLNGPKGKAFENKVSNMADGFIKSLETAIKQIDEDKAQRLKALQDAIKAAEAKKIEEARMKEKKRKKEMLMAAAKAAAAKKLEAEQRARELAKTAAETAKKAVKKKVDLKAKKPKAKKKKPARGRKQERTMGNKRGGRVQKDKKKK